MFSLNNKKLGFLFFVMISLFVSYALPFKFIAFSDTHIGHRGEEGKNVEVEKLKLLDPMIKEMQNDENIKLALIVGDLVDHGWADPRFSCCGCCNFINEWQGFQQKWIIPLISQIGTSNIYLCAGNHEKILDYRKIYCKSAYKKVKKSTLGMYKSSNDINYYFEREGVFFICCGIYPDFDICLWLDELLLWIGQRPVIIFFHYNIKGKYSEFWTDNEKQTFYDLIQKYNIKAIINGHIHKSSAYLWNNKIQVVNVGGYNFTVFDYSNGQLTWQKKS